MAKELPYFQFEPAEYLTKDISFCSLPAQGLFINICSYYWQRECHLTETQILRRFNYPDLLKELIDEKVIRINDEQIKINFLFEQYYGIIKDKEDSSAKGRIGNLKRWNRPAYDRYVNGEISLEEAFLIPKPSPPDELAIAKSSQIREEEIKEDKNKIPTFIEFRDYAIENKPLANIKDLKLKYDSWVANGWKDGHDKKILNWKSKILNTLPFIKESIDTPVDQYAAHMRNLTRA